MNIMRKKEKLYTFGNDKTGLLFFFKIWKNLKCHIFFYLVLNQCKTDSPICIPKCAVPTS